MAVEQSDKSISLQVQLPADVVELMRQEAVSKHTTIGEVLRRQLANGQFLESVVASPNKELLIDEGGKLSKVSFAER
jgi:hypothetical protein